MPKCHTCDRFYFRRSKLEKFMDQFYCEKCVPHSHVQYGHVLGRVVRLEDPRHSSYKKPEEDDPVINVAGLLLLNNLLSNDGDSHHESIPEPFEGKGGEFGGGGAQGSWDEPSHNDSPPSDFSSSSSDSGSSDSGGSDSGGGGGDS